MNGGPLPANLKRTSVLRRVPHFEAVRLRQVAGTEGDVCVFEFQPGSPVIVEAVDGRLMTLVPGDVFLATAGYRESTRWVVGTIPSSGLVPDTEYWILADCGIVGELISDSPLEKGHLARVRYVGRIQKGHSRPLNIRQFSIARATVREDRHTPLYLVLGTAAEVGKTTAGLAITRALLQAGHKTLIVLKATGTSSFTEIARYLDFGAAHAFDCVDFGLPTTYPSGRGNVRETFEAMLDLCFSLPADALVIECGGDLFGANVPEFLSCLKRRRSKIRVILAASDALAAIGAKRVLEELELSVSLITGPCTDTPTLRERTQTLCTTPAINLANAQPSDTQMDHQFIREKLE